jgi:pimeloyl-ACP methyl ester carboxylesterase
LKALSALDFTKIGSRGEAEEVLSEYIKDEGTKLFLLKNLYRKGKTEFGLRINLPVLTANISEVGAALPDNSIYKGETLFVGGERSGYIEPLDELLIKKHFPNASIERVPNAGHWLHADNPDAFYAVCDGFINQK